MTSSTPGGEGGGSGIWRACAVLLMGVCLGLATSGCKGADGEGGITYVDYTYYGAYIFDDNPSIPYSIVSGQEYACSKGSSYDVVIQTSCGVTLYTYGSYSCDQTDGESTLLIFPTDGEDDHNKIEVYDCGSYLTDSLAPPGPIPTEADVVEGEIHTATQTRGNTTFTFTWLYTRDPEVARGKAFKPLLSQAGD